jgi:uncharacterized protein (DUF1015 family)
MRTYAEALNEMNTDLKEATAKVKKLENNLIDANDIIKYLYAYNYEQQIKEIYFSFFSFCLRQNFDLDKEISI